MRDIIRTGGTSAYTKAMQGELGGVDMKGSTMSGFIGIDVLTELLVMGKVGIFVDMPQIKGPTLADIGPARPYLYHYQVEDILAWSCSLPESPNTFQALLLRDRGFDYAQHEVYDIDMPCGEFERYRLMWVDKKSGFVRVQFYNKEGQTISADGMLSVDEPLTLHLREIPFIMLDIGGSVLKDIAQHQVALLNLASSDVSYALKANFPFFTEQRDMRAVGDHMKNVQNPDGTAMGGGQRASGREIEVGASHGRAYDLKAERPQFIHPSSEPLIASMALQEKLEDDVRKLVNLAVTNKIGKRATSAEALKLSDQGLEAGLSYIGLVLEAGERRVAYYWAAYEDRIVKHRKIATIKYPDRYSLKTDSDRISEASKLSELMFTVPSTKAKKEIAKSIATKLFSGYVDTETLLAISAEIEKSAYSTSDPDTIIRAKEAGLIGDQVASTALGFEDDEYLQAREDHIARVKRILETQTAAKEDTQSADPGARGVDDLSDNPATEGKAERAAATDTTMKDTTKKPIRGAGKSPKEKE